MNKEQLVSVIITTKNEEDVIERLIKSIKSQTFKNIEIILVDNNSKDRTIKITKRFVVKIYNFGPERSAQRNFGAKKAGGNYFLFLDADMKLSKSVIKECFELCQGAQKIGGVIIPEESKASTFWEKVKAFERSFYNEQGDEITDAARFFKKIAFNQVGGYDEEITGPEDWDLPESIKKSGYKIGRINSKIYHYERIKSLFEVARKKFYYGLRVHRYLAKQNISPFNPKTIYFLRPVFYKKINKFLAHPVLSMGLFIMLTIELIAGGLGFLIGRIKKL